MMLELSRDAGNIEALVQAPGLLGALSRVLADDYPRGSCSPALLYNVVCLLLVFSNFHEASWSSCGCDIMLQRYLAPSLL